MKTNFRSLAIAVGLLTTFAVPVRATVVYSNDFSSNSNGFSGGTIQTSPSGENFLGPFTQGGSTTLTITGLTPHTTVGLSFTLDVIGSLDGDGQFNFPLSGPDPFLVSLNGTQVFNYTFANFTGGNTQNYPVAGSAPDTGAATVGTLGYSGFPGPVQDSTYNLTLSNLLDSSSTISLVFTGNSNEGTINEFYGIDNVVVSTNATPLPAALPLFAGGLGVIGLLARRRKRKNVAALEAA